MKHGQVAPLGRDALDGARPSPGDPYGEVRDAWHAKETLRSVYDITDPDVGAATVAQLAKDLQDSAMPTEINRLGRTIWRWRTQIANWHTAPVTNAATEAANNLVKRVNAPRSGSPTSATTASGPFSTPANPTGHCSTPSLRPDSRRAG